jgi:hypothetical protein
MAPQHLEGPKGKFVSLERAAKWLDISESTFRRLLEEHRWIRPVKMRSSVRYDSLDIAVLGHLLTRLPEKSEKSFPCQEGSGGVRSIPQLSGEDGPES